jgi:hypothetical protein
MNMKRSILFFSLFCFILLISLPFLVAAYNSDTNYEWSGVLFNPQDGNSYFAKMYEGWRGEWRFTLPYTAEPGEGGFLFLFYLLLGHLSRISGLSIVLVFHLTRLVAAIVLFFSLKKFFFTVFQDRELSRKALYLVCFGSGLGWLLFFGGYVSANFWVAEAYPFLSSFANPHFPLGLSLLLVALTHYLKQHPALSDYLLLLIYSLLLSVVMPFGIVIGCLVIAGEVVYRIIRRQKKEFLAGLAFILGGAPFLIYQFIISNADPVLKIWNEQNNTPSPPFWDFLISFSPIILIAIWGVWRILKFWKRDPVSLDSSPGLRLLIIWFILGILLIYFPFSLQRRFMFGFFVPVCGLGIWALTYLSSKKKDIIWKIIFPLSIISNIFTVLLAGYGIIRHDPLFFISTQQAQAIEWIKINTPSNALVLTSAQLGVIIPAQTGRRVIYGHPFETVNALQERNNIEKFFAGDLDTAQISTFISQRNIQFIIFDASDGMWGSNRFPDCAVSFDDLVVICSPGEFY